MGFAILGVLVTLFVVGASALFAAIVLANNLLYICEPNEVLIFSGGRSGGERRGFRIIKGGRGYRIPLLERVDKLELTNMIIDVAVSNAYSKGGIPLTVQGVANLKIAGDDPVLSNAVERLLGKSRDEIVKIAKDVLEGNLRGVLAQLTPEEVNEDKLAFAVQLQKEAEHDLSKLGLVLDTMKIQNVQDERGYLNSIGRKKSADIIKTARIAEARAKANAYMRDAANRQRARLREIESEQAIATAEAERRIGEAKTKSTALVAEAEGQVASQVAKAQGAVEAAEQKVEQTRRRLEADVIEPARASMEAGINAAKGRSSRILEEGRATVMVLEEMIDVWHKAGDSARDIFLMQKLQRVLDAMTDTISTVKVDKLTMLPPAGEGGDDTARRAVRLVEELKGAIGVDIPKLLTDYASSRNPQPPAPQ
jgi:flotillin